MRLLTAVLLIMTLGVASALGQSSAYDTIGVHVVQPGETLESITKKYLGSTSLWKENWKLNPDVKDPHMIKPGQKIRVIVARNLPIRSAEISAVARRVEKKPDPRPWEQATSGDKLKERDGIHTYQKSSAQLRFDDGSNLTLTEDSLVFLRQVRATPTGVDRNTIEIVDGQAELEARPSPSRKSSDIEIVVGKVKAKPKPDATGAAQTRARTEKGSAKLMAYKGTGSVEAGGAKVELTEGTGTSVQPGKKPTPPEKLLPAPALRAVDRPRPSFEVSWDEVPAAASYVVEICRDPECAQLIDRGVGITSNKWKPSAPMQLGDLYWRVTARSATGLDGFPSPASKLTIGLQLEGAVRIEGAGAASVTGARIRIFRDGGDGQPGGDDAEVATLTTDASGRFRTNDLSPAAYWIAVDSRSLGQGVWAEQTAGPAASLCADRLGGTRRIAAAGPCFGGRRGGVSDDASSLASAEHLALVSLAGDSNPLAEDVEPLVFTFAYDVVTNADNEGQGSLRQVLMNAGAMPEMKTSRFVPAVPPNGSDLGESRWILTVDPLPDTASTLAINGTALDLDGRTRLPLTGAGLQRPAR